MTRTLAFVDAIETGQARLIAADGHTFTLPRALLPEDATEGAWVSLDIAPAEPPDRDTDVRRRALVDDDGGDLKL